MLIKKLLKSKIFLNKEGKFSSGVINTAIVGLVFLVVLLAIYAAVVPEAQVAGDAMNSSNQCVSVGCFYNASNTNSTIPNTNCLANSAEFNETCSNIGAGSGLPLAGLFSSTGVVFVIVMAALLILIVRAYIKSKSK